MPLYLNARESQKNKPYGSHDLLKIITELLIYWESKQEIQHQLLFSLHFFFLTERSYPLYSPVSLCFMNLQNSYNSNTGDTFRVAWENIFRILFEKTEK